LTFEEESLVRTTLFLALVISCSAAGLAAAQAQSPAAAPAPPLNYEYFKAKVEPVLLAKRPGHARCVACHGQGTPLRFQPLAPGATAWTEEESRKNFDVIKRVAQPGNLRSRLLMHPLEEQAGGDFYHNGGKHFASQNDPEFQVLKAFVMGQAN
jgi:hypothetical protein